MLLKRLALVSLAVASIVLSACGSSGTVNVEFKNSNLIVAPGAALFNQLKSGPALSSGALTFASLAGGADPAIFQMKLVAMYLVEDIDANMNNVGALTRIWSSKKCDSDLTLCGIGPAAGAYVVDYFDFAQTSAEVNAELASYARDTAESTVNPGTYRYIRLDFQGATGAQTDTTVANMKFGPDVDTEFEIRAQKGQQDVALPEPMVIAAGESFTVNLAYDIEKSFYATAGITASAEVEAEGRKLSCASGNAESDGTNCMAEPIWAPTVTKN